MEATRRTFLQAGAALASAGFSRSPTIAAEKNFQWQSGQSPWPMCLDTATLSKDVPLEKKVDVVAHSEFDAIEPWDRELAAYEETGQSLKELGASIREKGLFVPSVIGLWGSLGNTKEDFEAAKYALLEVSMQRLHMRNEMFSHPMSLSELYTYLTKQDGTPIEL